MKHYCKNEMKRIILVTYSQKRNPVHPHLSIQRKEKQTNICWGQQKIHSRGLYWLLIGMQDVKRKILKPTKMLIKGNVCKAS